MRAHESEFRQAGARLAAIGLGDAGYARAFREESGIGFPLLIDADRAAYRMAGLKKASLLHLLRRDNFAARKRAQAAATVSTSSGRIRSSSAAVSSSPLVTSIASRT